MNRFYKHAMLTAITAIGIGAAAGPAHANGVGFAITDVERTVSDGVGNSVTSTLPGLFDEMVELTGDPTATASQNSIITPDGFSGTLLAGGESSAAHGSHSIIIVNFTLITPHQVDLSAPLVTSEIDNPFPFGVPGAFPGAILFLDKVPGDFSTAAALLNDNGGLTGELPPFDSDVEITNFTDSFSLAPGDYIFFASAVVLSGGGTGSAEVQFNVTFTNVPEPGTATLALLSVGGLLMRRRRAA